MQPENLIAHQLPRNLKSATIGAIVMISQELLKELFYYFPTSGIFVFKYRNLEHFRKGLSTSREVCQRKWNSEYPGLEAGHDENGYVKITIFGNAYFAHRLIFLYMLGVTPDQVDHINRDRSDNRFSNLRDVNCEENNKNRPIQSNCKSGVMGVNWTPKIQSWRIYIHQSGKRIHLGYRKDFDEAVKIRKEAEIEYGFHPNHNSID